MIGNYASYALHLDASSACAASFAYSPTRTRSSWLNVAVYASQRFSSCRDAARVLDEVGRKDALPLKLPIIVLCRDDNGPFRYRYP